MICFWVGPWPWTSAEGLSTRSSSAGRLKVTPLSKATTRIFSARLRRISTGQWVAPRSCVMATNDSRLVQAPGLVDQHDGNAVADGTGQPRLAAEQLAGCR